MSGTWKWYGKGLLKVATGLIDFDTDAFYIMLTTSAYTPDQDVHEFRSAVTNEVSNSGTYTSGGQLLQGVSVTYDATSNEVRILWTPDPAFTSATITARTAVIYKRTGADFTTPADDPLVAFCTEAADVTSTAGTFTIDLPSTAVLKLTAAA